MKPVQRSFSDPSYETKADNHHHNYILLRDLCDERRGSWEGSRSRTPPLIGCLDIEKGRKERKEWKEGPYQATRETDPLLPGGENLLEEGSGRERIGYGKSDFPTSRFFFDKHRICGTAFTISGFVHHLAALKAVTPSR